MFHRFSRETSLRTEPEYDVEVILFKTHAGTMMIVWLTFYIPRYTLMLLWFADLMNVTEEVTIHRPNVSTLPSSAFIRSDLNAATRGPFI